MKVSIDLNTYKEYRLFFDTLADAMQKQGHSVGIITGHRETEREKIMEELYFEPDFMYLWGETETIANANLWKCEKMDQEDVFVHFDEEARELKRYTDRWVFKSLNSSQPDKF